ncbi:DUF2341 domain-containing protein [Candidatus Roizmanbacteria bacterium]|nr:DUF2341 domain-containing protein [Candidatus Roizmanbacteria bacterium]
MKKPYKYVRAGIIPPHVIPAKAGIHLWDMILRRKILIISTFVILFFLPIAYLTTRYQSKTEAAWLDDHWGYRQTVAITNSGVAQTDFQVQVTVDTATLITAGKMQSDCDDIRLTDVSGKILPYWISNCNNASTKIWPKVPSIPTSGTIIYLYYGNPSAQSAKITVGTQTYPGLSCKSILDAGNSTGNGTYWIDTTNGNSSDKQQVYCDMTNNSGGWILVTPSMVDSFAELNVTKVSSTDTNGGAIYTYTNTATGCGGPQSGATVLITNSIQWDVVKVKESYNNGTSSCWSTNGDGNYGGQQTNSNMQAFAPGTDTLQNCVLSCSTSPYVMPPMSRCDNAPENFTRFNSASERSFEAIVRRINRTTLSGPALGLSCNAVNMTSKFESIYIRENSLTYATLSVGAPSNETKSLGPVAYWKFDEGYGTNTRDSSPNASNGTVNSATWKSEDQCLSGKCLFFTSTNTVSIADPVNGSLDFGTGDFTISAWIRTASSASNRNLIRKGAGAGLSGWRFGIEGGVPNVLIGDTVGYTEGNVGSTSVADNKWHLVTVVFNRSSNAVGYVDGNATGGVLPISTKNGSVNNSSTVDIGNTFSAFSGSIDEVKIFNYARTAAQIKSDFAGKGLGSIKGTSVSMSTNAKNNDALSNGLTTYLKSDEASGNGADSSGNANTTTVSGTSNYGGGKFGNGLRSGVASTNLEQNPSVETNLTGWGGWNNSGTATREQSSDTAKFGTYSFKQTVTGDGNQEGDSYGGAVTEGQTYTVSFWVNVTAVGVGESIPFYYRVFHDTGNYIPGTIATINAATSGWVRYSMTQTIPNNGFTGNNIQLSFYTNKVGTVVYVDGVQIEQSATVTPYLDGSLGTGYAWTGTAHNSTSTRAASTATTATNVNDTTGTIAYWFNSPSLDTSAQCPLGSSNGDSTGGMFFSLKNTGVYLTHNYATSQNVTPQYVATINNNTWYHVAYNWDNSTLKGNLYVNGALQQNISYSQAITIGEYFQNLGTCTRTGYTTFNGTLDDIRTYNRVLSPKEVRDLYNWSAGPVGYWNMDEKTGTNAYDQSGNGYTGTLTGSTWISGKYGSALSLNGSTDRVSVGTMTGKYGGMVTVEGWVNHTTTADWDDIVAGACGDLLFAFNTSSQLTWGGQCNSPFGMLTYTTNIDGAWHHVAGTYDGSMTRLYVDGVQVNSIARTGSFTPSALYIGSAGATEYFKGKLDDVKIYNYARSSKQIVEDMNAGHPAGGSPVGSQVSYWKFDEGYGVTANNQISGQPNFTFTGAPNDPTWDNNGKFGKAVYFDGALSVTSEDYADASYTAQTWDDGTLSVWIKPDSIPAAEYYPISDYNGVVGESGGWLVAISSNGGCSIRGNASYNSSCPANTFQANQWTHIAWVVSKTQGFLKTYANGKLINTITGNTLGFRINTTLRVGMGSWCGTGSDCIYPGFIDEVKLYSSALTSDEIALDYNRGASMVLGAMSDTSGLSGGSVASSSATASYCVPGGTDPCTPPVGEWNFEEKTGQTVNDVSGNNNSGTLGANSTPSTDDPSWAQGKYGAALTFDGNNDFVQIPYNANLDLAGSAITVSTWMKPPASKDSDWEGVVGNYPGNSTGYMLGWRESSNNNFTFYLELSSGHKEVTVTNLANYADLNSWIYVVGTYDGSAMRIYVNGRLINTTSSLSGTINASAQGLRFGRYGGSYVGGSIDQVKIFNYARTPAQIAWDYNRGGPVGHWKFDECQGITANDSSGNGNSGTITIGATVPQSSVGTCTVVDTATAWYNGATGKYNASLNFDGVDDFVNVGSYTPLNNIGDEISVSAWVKTSINNTFMTIVGRGNDWRMNKNASGYYEFEHRNTSQNIVTSRGLNSSTNWVHVVGTYKKDDFVRLYIDGVLVDSDAQTLSTRVSQTQNQIGNNYAWHPGPSVYNDYWWNGQIDDVRVFNYALTPAQIKQVYNQGGGIRFGPATGSP